MSIAPRLSASSLSSIVYALLVAAGAKALHRSLGSEPGAVSEQALQETANAGARGGWWTIVKRTYAEVNKDRVQEVAGGVTFYGLLSLFPAITVLVSLFGLFADPAAISDRLDALQNLVPPGAIDLIREQVTRIGQTSHSTLGVTAIIGLLVALWSANSAMKVMMDALNIAYDTVEKRGFVMLNLVSLGFTLGTITCLIILIGVIAAVPIVLAFFSLGAIGDVLLWAGRWPVILVLIGGGLAVLYQWGPSRPDVSWRWITPGSILASVGLLVFSMLFSWYAANFANYNGTYGSLGAVIGFLIWMWLSVTIVLVGAELNAEVEAAARPGRKPGESESDKK